MRAHPAKLVLKSISRKGGKGDAIPKSSLHELFAALAAGRIYREAVRPLLELMAGIGDEATGAGVHAFGEAMRRLELDDRAPEPDLGREIDAVLGETGEYRYAGTAQRHRHAMGLLMARVGGRLSGRSVARALETALNEPGPDTRRPNG